MKLCARAAHPSLFVILFLDFISFFSVGLTGVSKRGSDLDGCEVLQERLELQGGELRPPLAAGPLVQSVQKKTEVQTMFQEDDVFSLHCPSTWNLMNLRENRNHFDVFLLIALLIFGLQVTS